MTDRELKKLNRAELLEILVEQSKQIEELNAQNEQLKQELSDKQLMINEAGSIAQASMELNHVFQAAQSAADQYLLNVKNMTDRAEEICAQKKAESLAEIERMTEESTSKCERVTAETTAKCEQMTAETTARCEKMENDTRARCDVMVARANIESDRYWEEVSVKLEKYYNAHKGLRELLSIKTLSCAEGHSQTEAYEEIHAGQTGSSPQEKSEL